MMVHFAVHFLRKKDSHVCGKSSRFRLSIDKTVCFGKVSVFLGLFYGVWFTKRRESLVADTFECSLPVPARFVRIKKSLAFVNIDVIFRSQDVLFHLYAKSRNKVRGSVAKPSFDYLMFASWA